MESAVACNILLLKKNIIKSGSQIEMGWDVNSPKFQILAESLFKNDCETTKSILCECKTNISLIFVSKS